uniref:Fibronectin type-III domain-containing protein n=2 Tax=Mesocestoides corti TaxID=53468 RepID=A0A5K3EJ09_MESCO
VRGLRPNTNYECFVEASTTPLITQWSDSLTSTSTKSPVVTTWPGTLQRLFIKEVVVVDAHTLLVSWYDPKNVEGTLGGFTVSVGRYGRESPNKPEWRHVANVTADSRSYRITDLEPDTRYEVTVRGYVLPNEDGHGGGYSQYPYSQSASTWSAATRKATATTTRPVIQPSLYLDWTDASGLHVRWDFQDVMHGSIQKIELIVVPVDSDLGVTNASAIVAPNATEGSITTGLRPYTEYDVVVEFTTNGATTAYTAGRAWTWSSAPSPPTDITAKALSSSSIMVSWSPPAQTNGPLKPYRVHCTRVGEKRPHSATTKDNATTSVEVRGLRPNTNYECYVEASTTPLITQWSDSLTSMSAKSPIVTMWPGSFNESTLHKRRNVLLSCDL